MRSFTYRTDDKQIIAASKLNMSSNKQQKEVELFLSQCGLLQYFKVFIEEGFERIESVKYICF